MKQYSVTVRLTTGQHVTVTISAYSSTEARAAARQMFPGCSIVWTQEL